MGSEKFRARNQFRNRKGLGEPRPFNSYWRRRSGNFDENDHEREQHERFDEGEAENQTQLNRGTGGGISSEAFASGGGDFGLPKGCESDRERHRETGSE